MSDIEDGVSSGCETDSSGTSGYDADNEVSDIEDGGESGSPVMQETGDTGSELIIIPTFQHHNSEGSLVTGRYSNSYSLQITDMCTHAHYKCMCLLICTCTQLHYVYVYTCRL